MSKQRSVLYFQLISTGVILGLRPGNEISLYGQSGAFYVFLCYKTSRKFQLYTIFFPTNDTFLSNSPILYHLFNPLSLLENYD